MSRSTASASRIVFGAVFSIVFSSFGGFGAPRVVGVRVRVGAALVRFIAGDADLATARVDADDDLRAREPDEDLRALEPEDDLRPPEPAADLRPAEADDDFLADEPLFFADEPDERLAAPPVLFAPFDLLAPERALRPDPLFVSSAFRAGEARSDLAYATS